MEKQVRFQENYEEKQSGIPLTSYVSEKFLEADKFRSPYDLRMMKLYDSTIRENYSKSYKKYNHYRNQ